MPLLHVFDPFSSQIYSEAGSNTHWLFIVGKLYRTKGLSVRIEFLDIIVFTIRESNVLNAQLCLAS